MINKKVCFFSTVPKQKLLCESYSIQDINILNDLGYEVVVTDTFSEIPYNCDLYFSWWASGSIFPLIKSFISRKPLITVAGGNEVMLYRDSVDGSSLGFLNTPLYKKIATYLVLLLSERIIVVSSFMKFNSIIWRTSALRVIHNCVDTQRFIHSDVPKVHILSIFKLDKDVVKLKRGDVYINAIEKVVKVYPFLKFVIIGRQLNAFDFLFSMVQQKGLESNIFFVDEVPNSDLVDWIQQSLLYVQISDTETFGLTIAEAMSCQIPVLVSSQGAIPEVVGDMGIYVNHNDADSVANGLFDFLKMSEEKRKFLGENLRNRIVELYSYENRKAKIKSLIDEILY
jgi:glycosyltransferase involved in cell wall biosynthesis